MDATLLPCVRFFSPSTSWRTWGSSNSSFNRHGLFFESCSGHTFIPSYIDLSTTFLETDRKSPWNWAIPKGNSSSKHPVSGAFAVSFREGSTYLFKSNLLETLSLPPISKLFCHWVAGLGLVAARHSLTQLQPKKILLWSTIIVLLWSNPKRTS